MPAACWVAHQTSAPECGRCCAMHPVSSPSRCSREGGRGGGGALRVWHCGGGGQGNDNDASERSRVWPVLRLAPVSAYRPCM